MEELYEIGINEYTFNDLKEVCPEIGNISDADIHKKLAILSYIGCTESMMLDIICSNPFYMIRSNDEVEKLIHTLKNYGVGMLNFLVEDKPEILNLTAEAVEKYFNGRFANGESLNKIAEDLEENPNKFDEI